MDIKKIIRGYLPDVIHMSLSTSRDNKPWTCEVHYAYDDELKHLYIFTRSSSRHGQEIALNPSVSGNIVRQHGPSEKPRGVYFEGTARLLEDVSETHPAFLTFNGRFGRGEGLLEEASKPDGHKFYEIAVSDWYVFDAVESSPSQKYHLEL
jgi:uncharacterized protein YhbP (UPF0306 family)